MHDEILDIVDANDTVIGTINRKDYGKLIEGSLGYIRASELFIINDRGELWIPIRTSTKTIAPSGYDYSAAGHVESGDSYVDTIIRETKEEINLGITEADIAFVAKMWSDDTKYFRSVYLLHSNVTPDFNPNDFVSAEWLTPEKLIANIDSGHSTKASLRETVVRLQEYLGNESQLTKNSLEDPLVNQRQALEVVAGQAVRKGAIKTIPDPVAWQRAQRISSDPWDE